MIDLTGHPNQVVMMDDGVIWMTKRTYNDILKQQKVKNDWITMMK